MLAWTNVCKCVSIISSKTKDTLKKYLNSEDVEDSEVHKYLKEASKLTSIHGFNHFSEPKRHPLEHVTWALLILAAIGCSTWICLTTYERFRDNPTVISIEKNFEEWNHTFPSAFFCPIVKGDSALINKYSESLGRGDMDKTNITRRYINTLLNISYRNFDTLEEFAKYKFLPQMGLARILEQVKFNFSYSTETLGFTNMSSRIYRSNAILLDKGFCYAHNTMQPSNVGAPWQKSYDEMQADPRNIPVPNNKRDGASVIRILGFLSNTDVYWVSPDEWPLNKPIVEDADYANNMHVKLKLTMSLVSSEAVGELGIEQRKCRFANESNLGSSPVYSFGTCLFDCRIKKGVDFCQCAPFFVNKLDSVKECDISGMLCLARYSDALVKLQTSDCKCVSACEVSIYEMKSSESLEISAMGQDMIISKIAWNLVDFPTIRYKRDVIFTFTDLLVAFGGSVGLFLGCSILSLVEVMYIFTIRLAFHLYRKRGCGSGAKKVTRVTPRAKKEPQRITVYPDVLRVRHNITNIQRDKRDRVYY